MTATFHHYLLTGKRMSARDITRQKCVQCCPGTTSEQREEESQIKNTTLETFKLKHRCLLHLQTSCLVIHLSIKLLLQSFDITTRSCYAPSSHRYTIKFLSWPNNGLFRERSLTIPCLMVFTIPCIPSLQCNTQLPILHASIQTLYQLLITGTQTSWHTTKTAAPIC